MRRTTLVLGFMLIAAACGGDGTSDGDGEGPTGSVTTIGAPVDQGSGGDGGDICNAVAVDPETFGMAIGREGLTVGETGQADPDYFNVDDVVSCSYRYQDPVQTNRNDGFSVWAMPASSATPQQLADGAVSLNPSGLRAEALSDGSGFIAVFLGDSYLGIAGTDGETSAYAHINPLLDTPDILISIVQSALDG